MDLIIVESPTKAKTLSRFLGSGYSVEATMGHIKDLPKSKLGVDVEHDFEPDYIDVEKRSKEVKKIVSLAKKATTIFLASDPDREGEAIAAHVRDIVLASAASGKGSNLKRIVFHEITKEAVDEAISHPRDIDNNLVNAQTARRVLDRLVGYSLSPLLWKKVRRGLSAGRVQSVAVRLIVEREREISAFKPDEYWQIFVFLNTKQSKKQKFSVELIKVDGKKADVTSKEVADPIVDDLKTSEYSVSDIKRREVTRSPYPPFTTSTMTQAGARLFGWSSKRTMQIAQKLYEQGFITYHRTDSLNIASSALEKARGYINDEFGANYVPEKARYYKTNSKTAQEAHEAIRPTNIHDKNVSEDSAENKLYDLIWKRFLSSQMEKAVYDETTIEVLAIGSQKYTLRVSGQIMKFDGWTTLYGKKESDDVVLLPDVNKGEALEYISIDPQQKFTQPPPRYNEASLIKTLEKLGIGRPSTYAPTISTIQARSYVDKDEGRFTPTSVGIAVNDFLVEHFSDVFEYSFTAQMEDDLDNIANGKLVWNKRMKQFWNPFSKSIKEVEKNAKRVKIETEKLGRKCPECGEGELVIRVGRFGKFISCERFPDCKYTEKFMEKIMMKCPKCSDGDVIVKKTKKGRKFFGCSRYPECDYASWKNPMVKGKASGKDSEVESEEQE